MSVHDAGTGETLWANRWTNTSTRQIAAINWHPTGQWLAVPDSSGSVMLIDAAIIVTPCDAALSAKELEAIRALRNLGRPTAVVVLNALPIALNQFPMRHRHLDTRVGAGPRTQYGVLAVRVVAVAVRRWPGSKPRWSCCSFLGSGSGSTPLTRCSRTPILPTGHKYDRPPGRLYYAPVQ